MINEVRLKVDEFFLLASKLLEGGNWNADMQNVVDDLTTIAKCTESPEAVQECIDRLEKLTNN